jgi:hypothetical protein
MPNPYSFFYKKKTICRNSPFFILYPFYFFLVFTFLIFSAIFFSSNSLASSSAFISSFTSAISLFKKYESTVRITTMAHKVISHCVDGFTIDSKISFATKNSKANTK